MSRNRNFFLNNFKIKNKLVIIYIFCVVIPIVFTNYIMYSFIKQSALKEQVDSMHNTMNRLEYNLTEKLTACMSVSNYLYTDHLLNNFLNKVYENSLDYYNQYNNLKKDNVIGYYYTQESVYDIKIYTDNASIIRGGNFLHIKDVEEDDWYKEFIKSDKKVFLYSYYDEMNKYISIRGPARRISIIRYLDNFEKKGFKRILKIDLDYKALLKDVLNERENRDIYICDSKYILFNTQEPEQGFLEYKSKNEMELKEVTISSPISLVSQEWDIYITADKTSWIPQVKEKNSIWIILTICNLILPTIVIILINQSFSNRIHLTEAYLRKVEREEFERIECYEGKDEIGNLIRSYNLMVMKIKELIEVVFKKNVEKQALELSKTQAELNALQSQINPHFLFNTLESIRMRSLIKEEMETANIIGELANLMRRTIEWGEDFISIAEEMRFVDSYLNIQKYRFGDRLKFSIHVSNECKDKKIVKFGIITFVENACIHGIEGKIEGGTITVVIFSDNDNIYVDIMDNGIGMSQERLEELQKNMEESSVEMLNQVDNIGILNTYIRLNTYYKGKAVCAINSTEGEGTDVHMVFPLH